MTDDRQILDKPQAFDIDTSVAKIADEFRAGFEKVALIDRPAAALFGSARRMRRRGSTGKHGLHYCQRIYERGCQEKYLPVGRQPGHNDTVEAASPSFGLCEPMCQRSKNCNA